MNPRPILIATCCALALVAFVYFFGKQHFSPSVDETVDQATRSPTSKPVTVNKSPTPSESPLTHSPPTRYSTETSSKVAVENSSAPSADTGEFRAALDSKIQTDPSLSENFKERVRLFNESMALSAKAESYKMPEEHDFENYDDYLEALGKHLDIVIPLGKRARELYTQYIRISSTPESFAENANLFRQQIRDHEPEITDEEIDKFLEELKP